MTPGVLEGPDGKKTIRCGTPQAAGGASPVWEDGFESGTLQFVSTENEYGWGSTAELAGPIEVNQENPRTGSYSLLIQFNDGGNLQANGTWDDPGSQNTRIFWQMPLDQSIQEFWKEYYLYVPDNYVHPDVENSSQNRKFWAVWDDERIDEDVSMFVETFSASDSQSPPRTSKFRVFMDTDETTAGGTGNWWSDGAGDGCGVPNCVGNVLEVEDRGTWVQFRMHFKLSSSRGVDDGEFHVWKNGTLILKDETLPAYPSSTGNYFLHDGQIMGAANSPYPEQTKFYLDDVKVYDQDPGWLLDDVQIPAQGDFTAQGSILTPGSAGSWDERLPHGTPGPVIEMGGTYYMYYIGADGDRSGDGGPANRGVGVTTSSDLSSWSKSGSNPVIPWSDLHNNSDEEEGAWRLAGFNDGGTIVLYVTDLVGSGGSVNGDIRLFTSTDGVSFTDQGIVIAHDGGLPGDDEKGVLGAWKSDNGTVYVGYAAKGTDVTGWEFHIAEGSARDTFTSSTQVLTGSDYGHGTDPVLKSETDLLWMIGENGGEFYAYDPTRSDPPTFGTAEQTYTNMIDDQFALFLDRDGSTWHLYGAMGTQGDATSVDHWTAPMQEV